MKTMTKHVMEKHADVAEERMHNQDPNKWGKEMKPRWDATPDNAGLHGVSPNGSYYQV